MTSSTYYYFRLSLAALILNSCIGIESVDLTSKHSDVSVPTNDTDDTDSDLGNTDSDLGNTDSDLGNTDDPDSEHPGSDTPDSEVQASDDLIDSSTQQDPQDTDMCPSDPSKLEPGVCDCGTPDLDSDEDGTMDCDDECPLDNQKTAPGPCGCGVEAFSCWECIQAADCPEVEYGCEEPICIDGQCGTRPVTQGTKCREAIGECDEAEYCDGVHHNCPHETGIKESCVPGEPVTINSLGRTVTFSAITINGRDTNLAYVRPRATVTLEISGHVIDSETHCGSCMTQYYITLENAFTLCLGNGSDSWDFTVLHTFVAPETPGIYFVQTKDSWQYSCSPGIAGLIPDSNLAIIRVE